ncbi:carboxylesterase/lipase family protein [Amnibacterium endophyticum]|uniref:Carboxylic ester hydrolase n=1 Tax=Amnibacterium endophyticum TaxID=2109337 RepID=A0ABW4LJU8_9MICO
MAVPLVVPTSAGRVRGRREAGLTAWRGVPYAQPPVGSLRLRAPRPPEPWAGVLEADRDGPLPPQPRTGRLTGAGVATPTDEDCLTLTVVRRTAGDAPKPVMVFVHGGAYAIGGGTAEAYRGESLAASADVVFVGFNYRLGALGWLDLTAHGTEERPIEGNLGLRDQLAVLAWVRREIGAFGGDPENVTLFGESAGATSVLALMTCPAAAGLFDRAIAESPAIGAVHGSARSRGWAAELVASLPGGATDLLEAPADALVAATGRLDAVVSDRTPGARLLGPVVDGDLLPGYPLEVLRSGGGHPVPLVVGTNADEGTLFQWMRVLRADAARLERLFAAVPPDVAAAVSAEYPGPRRPHRLARFVTDLMFRVPVEEVAAGRAGAAPVWVYRFEFAPRAMRLIGLGAAHGAELDHVFARRRSRTLDAALLLGGRRAARGVTRRMAAAWRAFAHDGAPPARWPRFEPGAALTLVVDAVDRVERDPGARLRDAWAGWRAWD